MSDWEKTLEKNTKLRVAGLLVGVLGAELVNDNKKIGELIDAFIKGNTALFRSLLHAEHTRTLKERDDTAYAKGIIKGREQILKEIEGKMKGMEKEIPTSTDKRHGKWNRRYNDALSDILSVLKEKEGR